MRKLMLKFWLGLCLVLIAQLSWAADFKTVVKTCNSHLYDLKEMRACGMLATQLSWADPINHGVAYFLRARAYLNLGKPEYAILDVTQTLALLEREQPSYAKVSISADALRPLAYAVRSTGYAKTGKPDEAAADRDKALSLATQAIDSAPIAGNYLNRATIYQLLGDNADAMKDAMRAWELTPHNADVLEARGEIFENLGNRTAASQDYHSALDSNPDQQHAQEGLTRLASSSGTQQLY
jgi:tetratricopeptide (TPR) repeat protein